MEKNRSRISLIINNTIRCSHNHWNNDTVYISIEVWPSVAHQHCYRLLVIALATKQMRSRVLYTNSGEIVQFIRCQKKRQAIHKWSQPNDGKRWTCVCVFVWEWLCLYAMIRQIQFYSLCAVITLFLSLFYLIRALALYFVGIFSHFLCIYDLYMTMTTAWDCGKVTANTSAYEYTSIYFN